MKSSSNTRTKKEMERGKEKERASQNDIQYLLIIYKQHSSNALSKSSFWNLTKKNNFFFRPELSKNGWYMISTSKASNFNMSLKHVNIFEWN